jgi:hypothetical protein
LSWASVLAGIHNCQSQQSRQFGLAHFLPIERFMGSFGKSAEPLIEILRLCEQTLAALEPQTDDVVPTPRADKTRASGQRGRTIVAGHLILIEGGLSRSSHGSEYR